MEEEQEEDVDLFRSLDLSWLDREEKEGEKESTERKEKSQEEPKGALMKKLAAMTKKRGKKRSRFVSGKSSQGKAKRLCLDKDEREQDEEEEEKEEVQEKQQHGEEGGGESGDESDGSDTGSQVEEL